MRFLDLALAAVIGLSSLALMASWGPAGNNAGAARLREEDSLRTDLESLLVTPGAVWLQQATLQEICAKVGSLSNQSVVYSASVDSSQCPLAAPETGPVASISLMLPTRNVTLEAWEAAPA